MGSVLKNSSRDRGKEIQHIRLFTVTNAHLHRLLCTGGEIYFHRLDVTVLNGGKNVARRFAISCSYSGREIIR